MMAAGLGPVDAKQLSCGWRCGYNALVNTSSLSDKIFVKSTDDNTRVIRLLLMQGDKMLAVYREKYPIVSTGKFQDLLVAYALISLTCFLTSQDVMAKLSECLNYWQWEILIGV